MHEAFTIGKGCQRLKITAIQVTHCGLVTVCSVSELSHHWFKQWYVACQAPSHYWTNSDYESQRYEKWTRMKLKWTGSKLQWIPWWRHQMETFSALLAICAGNSPVHGEFPAQRPVTRIFDAFFDLRPNKRLSKQSWGWWSETPSSSLWRHRNL